MTSHVAGKSALDEFLPESALASEISRFRGEPRGAIDLFVSAQDIQLDPIEVVARRAPGTNSSSVQLWPMLAAAFVALGVSMLALAAFARFGVSAL
jgi:hypothetical protein